MLFLGLESGSSKIQKDINKNLNINKIFPILEATCRYNMKVTLSFLFGFPEETHEDLAKTLSVMHQIKRHGLMLMKGKTLVDTFITALVYFSSTELTERTIEQLVYDPTHFDKANQPVSIPLDVKELIQQNKLIFPQYFNLPKMIDYKYKFLSTFINGMFSNLYDKEYKIIDKVIAYYSDDILKMYEYIYEHSSQEIERIYRISDEISAEKEVETTILHLIKKSLQVGDDI